MLAGKSSHYKSSSFDPEKEAVIGIREMHVNVDLIAMQEFQDSLKKAKKSESSRNR